MSNSLVRLDRDGDVATLTFDDPERRNAMTEAMGAVFVERIAELVAAPPRAVILTGAGHAFSAGGDLAMIEERAREGRERPGPARLEIRETMRRFYKLFLSVRDLPCPTVAAINGHAIGAGLCVALACDLRLVAREAKVGLNFTRLGLHPGMAATWTLPRLVGPQRAAELLYTSRLLGGEEAAAIGLALEALPAAEVVPAARGLAAEIAASAPIAVAGVKRALARSLDATIEDQLSFEADEQAGCFETGDAHEGIAAATQRRPPKFAGH
jgi:enoyl-CoA hydratase/carnithine racemase